ncbi:hypothetical protein ACFVFI_05190 [Streptomyces sp. NPDC057705]|uniref:hypothetical protein n=1 Tax=Streptomyces sp. NPDC057705 TaxID=3346222 RepID=UPI0036828A87
MPRPRSVAYARARGLLTAAGAGLGADRIGEGLTALVSVRLDRPEFVGATRGELGNAPVRAGVTEAGGDAMIQAYLAKRAWM